MVVVSKLFKDGAKAKLQNKPGLEGANGDECNLKKIFFILFQKNISELAYERTFCNFSLRAYQKS